MPSVRITVDGADELRSLWRWLADDPELHGRVEAVEGPPAEGTLGPLLEEILVALAPGGAAAALAGSLYAWLKQRRGEVRLIVTRSDGTTVTLDAKGVKDLDTAALSRQLSRLTAQLAEELEAKPHPDAEA